MHDFYAEAVAGSNIKHPPWHPLACPNSELTAYLNHSRISRKFRQSFKPILPPTSQRPVSATPSAIEESNALGLSRPRSAPDLHLLKASEDCNLRLTGSYPSVW